MACEKKSVQDEIHELEALIDLECRRVCALFMSKRYSHKMSIGEPSKEEARLLSHTRKRAPATTTRTRKL